ncbi:MAG TPA: TonB-dependent receptor [Thermoanaerobaculia bacterium]|nr:TonB-dependent receptor [Thermoanaerobaculia bacterium]
MSRFRFPFTGAGCSAVAIRPTRAPAPRRRASPWSRAARRAVCAVLAVAAVALPGASPARAQEPGTIRGRVEGSNGEPARGAEATLVQLRRRTSVSDDGTFEFTGVPPGTYLLQVESPIQGNGSVRVTVAPGEEAAIEMQLNVVTHHEEVVVTASPEVRSRLEVAAPISVMTGEELLLRRQATLGETLADMPGISSSHFAAGASRPVIRGMDGDRVRMLQGGVGAGDVSDTSHDHAVTIDPLSAERIEVIRGPATLLYGSSAIGGVVNVEDGRIPSYRSAGPLSGTVELGGGSVADDRNAAASLEGGGGRLAWRAGGFYRKAKDYEIPGFAEAGAAEEEHGEAFGVLPTSDVENRGASLGGTLFLGNTGYVGLSVSGFDSEYGLPGGHHEEGEEHEGEEDEEEEEVRIDMKRRRVDLHGETTQAFGPFAGLRVRAGVTDYEHEELEGAEVGTVFANDYLEGRLELIQSRRGIWSGAIGLQVSDRELEAVGEEAFIPPTDSQDWAIFALEELAWDRWKLQLGARLDNRDVEAKAAGSPDRDFDGVSSSLGVVFLPAEGSSIALSVARSVKFPSVEELYSNGLHVATSAFEIGDPDLDVESSLGFDLSFRRSVGRVAGEITLFLQDFDDFIFQRFTGDEEEGFPVVAYSQTDAEFRGGEVQTSLSLHESRRRHLDLKLFGDYVRAEQSASGEPLPRIPPLGFGAGLHFHGERFHAMVETRHREDQDRLAPNETPTASYTVLNASFSYRFFTGAQVYDLVARGRNLTDEDVRSHTSFVKDRVPLPGRDLSLALRMSF